MPLKATSFTHSIFKFHEKIFCDLEVNHKIHENIVPQKFGTIQYMICSQLWNVSDCYVKSRLAQAGINVQAQALRFSRPSLHFHGITSYNQLISLCMNVWLLVFSEYRLFTLFLHRKKLKISSVVQVTPHLTTTTAKKSVWFH